MNALHTHRGPSGKTRVRRILAAGVAALCAVTLAACSSGGANAAPSNEEGQSETIKVGVIPAIAFAPVYIAMDKGYFEEEGLDVQAQVMQNAAAITPSVMNGQLHFGTAAVSPFIIARDKGLPLVAAIGQTENSAESNDGALVLAEGSDIERPKDLEGHKVAINAVGALPHISTQEVIVKDGGDLDKVEFVVMGFPEMAGALEKGEIDAAAVTEPFTSVVEGNGGSVLSRTYFDAFLDRAPISLIFTSQTWADKNPEVMKKFQSAMSKAIDDASADPDLVAKVMEEYGGLAPEMFDHMVLSPFTAEIDIDGMIQQSEVMQELGYISKPLDGDTVLWQ